MKELDYYTVNGALGWSQDWFADWRLHIGGCGAVTACDACLLLARDKGLSALYPYDPQEVRWQDYLSFARHMGKAYLWPRFMGIDTLAAYLEGLFAYCQDAGVRTLDAEGLGGDAFWQEAAQLVRTQIDDGIVVPFLLLHHTDKAFADFQWHWFNLAGYEVAQGRFLVKAVTYGQAFWLDLERLWQTGHRKKGGMIRLLVS